MAWALSLWPETEFIYRVMHVRIEFKLKMSDRKKSFSCFFDNPNWSVKPSWLRPPQAGESTEKKIYNFPNFNLKRNRSRRNIFSVEKKGKALCDDQVLVLFFPLQISMYMVNEKIFVLLISQPFKSKTVFYICFLHSLEFRAV